MTDRAGRTISDPAGTGRNVLLLRTGITFALLLSAFSVQFRDPELFLVGGFRYLYAAVVLSYGWLLLRFALWGSGDLRWPVFLVQAGVDVAFVSLILFATGLYESVFTFMYVIFVLLGSLEKFLPGGIFCAAASAATYVVLVQLQQAGLLLPPGFEPSVVPSPQLLRAEVTHTVGFLLSGLLSGMLGEDLRKSRQRARDQEGALQELETFHRHVVETLPSGIVTVDPQGRIGLINGTACQILGIRREEAEGRGAEEILAGLTLDSRGRGSPERRPEVLFRRRDGTEIHLGFSHSPMRDADGSAVGTVVIFQDLTPIKAMEERIRVADRLAAMGELAAGLAHEIRNPLASITGSSQMLREIDDLPDVSRTLLQIIERESLRLNGLISDFLAYTTGSPRTVGPVDLLALAREVVEGTRAGEGRERRVEVSLSREESLTVEGDAEQLKQVLWNLVRNGVEATPPGGRVLLDLFRQERHGQPYAGVTVSDTGKGIDPSILGKIFNPFYTSKEGGTGLGLAISQRIVQVHRGFFEVRSTPGKGSVFSVFLPERRGENGFPA